MPLPIGRIMYVRIKECVAETARQRKFHDAIRALLNKRQEPGINSNIKKYTGKQHKETTFTAAL
jgi:hypothetical protein